MASYRSTASGRQLSLFTIDHDPLMTILDQIPIMERIRLERVCTSAGSVVSVSLRRVTEVDFSEFAKTVAGDHWTGILRRFREHVRTLKFCQVDKSSPYNFGTTKEILSALIDCLPLNQLEKLYIDGLTVICNNQPDMTKCVNAKMLQTFLCDPSMKPLRVLDCAFWWWHGCTFCVSSYDLCIQNTLKNCRNLVEFRLSDYSRSLQSEGLFPESLESIEFSSNDLVGAVNYNCIQIDELLGMGMNLLKNIVIRISKVDMSLGPDFAENYPNLKVLDLKTGSFNDLNRILETELTQLSLYGRDASLSSVFESLVLHIRASLGPYRLLETLKILHLPFFQRFSDKTMELITLFSNLEELNLEGVRCCTHYYYAIIVIDPMFRALPNLTILNLNDCESIVRDSTLESIGVFCPRIKYLDVSFCRKITNACIKSMIEALTANPERAETEEFAIKVEGTNISIACDGPIKFIHL